MSAFGYLRKRIGEFILVLISVWAVSAVCLNGFFLDSITEQMGYATRLGIVLGLDAILCIVLYWAAGTRGNHVVGAVGFLLVAAVFVIASLGMSGGESLYADAEGNYLYLALILVISSAACFLLTRTLGGSMAWFVAAAFACSLIQAFYQCEELPLSVVACVSALSLVVYRNFSLGVTGSQLGARSAGRLALPTAVVPVLAAAGVALLAWFVVIAPLSPGVVDVKLITEYRRLPIEEARGTAQINPQFNTDMTSSELVDGEPYTTDDFWVDDDSTKEVESVSVTEQLSAMGISGSGNQGNQGSSAGGGTSPQLDKNQDGQFNPISYLTTFPWVLIWIALLLVIIGLIVLFFILRRRRRMRRLEGYLSKPPRDQVVLIYRFIYKRLRRLGFTRPEGMTLREFASTSSHSMDMLTEEVGVSFEALTETYIGCVYGDCVPTEDDVVPFAAYYLRFWKAARAYLGNVKYFFKSFRL